MNAADIHKKYDERFQVLVRELFAELNELVKTENVDSVEVTVDVDHVARRTVGERGVDGVLLTNARLNLSVRYGG